MSFSGHFLFPNSSLVFVVRFWWVFAILNPIVTILTTKVTIYRNKNIHHTNNLQYSDTNHYN